MIKNNDDALEREALMYLLSICTLEAKLIIHPVESKPKLYLFLINCFFTVRRDF